MKRWMASALLAACLTLTMATPVSSAPSRTAAPWDLITGQQIQSASGARCTLGFNAYSGTARYILTAGHCASAATSWYGSGGYIGTSAGSSFPGSHYGRILVQSTDARSTPLVDRFSSGSDVTITGPINPPIGTALCASSHINGWWCGGYVTATNQTVCYPQGCYYQLIRSNLCSDVGGGMVVTNPGTGTTVKAVGIIVGGSGNCTTGGQSYIQLISEPLAAYGLTLYTG